MREVRIGFEYEEIFFQNLDTLAKQNGYWAHKFFPSFIYLRHLRCMFLSFVRCSALHAQHFSLVSLTSSSFFEEYCPLTYPFQLFFLLFQLITDSTSVSCYHVFSILLPLLQTFLHCSFAAFITASPVRLHLDQRKNSLSHLLEQHRLTQVSLQQTKRFV